MLTTKKLCIIDSLVSRFSQSGTVLYGFRGMCGCVASEVEEDGSFEMCGHVERCSSTCVLSTLILTC